MTPPGTRALRLARRWFGRATAARVFEPLVADWQCDVRDRPHAHGRIAANLRGFCAFVATTLALGGQRLLFSSAAMPALVMPALFLATVAAPEWWRRRGYPLPITALMVVSHLMVYLPLVALWTCRAHRRIANAWHLVATATLVAVLAALAVEGWLLPAAFLRELQAAGAPAAPVSWSLPILLTHGDAGDLPRAAAEVYRRLTAVTLPLCFGAFSIAAIRWAGRRDDRVVRRVLVGWGLALLCVTFGTTRIAFAVGTSAVTARWTAPLMAIAVLALAALCIAEASRRRRTSLHRSARPRDWRTTT